MNFSGKALILAVLIVLLSIPLVAKAIVHPYSYLSKPPISASISVSPDKEKYNRNEIITFKVIVELDTLKTEKNKQFKIVIGQLGEILVSSQLIKSDVAGSYDMNFEKNKVKMNFTVQMLTDDNPPYIKVEAIRLADENSVTKRQYRSMIIDQYEILYLTSPKFKAARAAGTE
jgi:hypothetical protein